MVVLSATSLKSDVMTTPVSTYFATSIKKSANFSFRWFTLTFGSSVFAASNCLLSCGFCGLDFSRLVVKIYALDTFLACKDTTILPNFQGNPRDFSVCVSKSKIAWRTQRRVTSCVSRPTQSSFPRRASRSRALSLAARTPCVPAARIIVVLLSS